MTRTRLQVPPRQPSEQGRLPSCGLLAAQLLWFPLSGELTVRAPNWSSQEGRKPSLCTRCQFSHHFERGLPGLLTNSLLWAVY